MKKHIGYARVSTEEQVEGFGLEAQITSIQAYSQAMGFELEDIIVDEGYSGSNVDRPGIQKVIELMGTCQYEGVIVYKLDRISRSLKDILILHDDTFVPCGCSIVSIKEQFDTSTASGRLLFQMIGGFAEFERTVIKDRMMAGKEQKAKQGMFAGGSAPYGYVLVDGQLVINEYEAKTVREVYEMRAKGYSLRSIASYMNGLSVKTKRGGKWSQTHVKDMLDREEVYRGMYKHGNVVTKGQHEPIL